MGRRRSVVKANTVSRAIFSRFAPLPEVLLSPILLRPVREQLEHDRVIRLLQAKYKRKFEVAINPGNEQGTPVTVGQSPWYPDLVLQSAERGRKVLGVVEVETAESVNKVEAMSQWAAFSTPAGAFHLYVPTSMIDVARQLCDDMQILVGEIWAYTALGDQMRFTLVQRTPRPGEDKAQSAAKAPPRRAARRARCGRAGRRRPARLAGRLLPAAARRNGRQDERPRAVPPPKEDLATGTSAETEVVRAVSAGDPRQARVRNHVPDALAPRRHPAALADPLRFPHAGRRARRARVA